MIKQVKFITQNKLSIVLGTLLTVSVLFNITNQINFNKSVTTNNSVIINDQTYVISGINRFNVTKDGSLIVDTSAKNVMTGSEVELRWASHPSVILSESGEPLETVSGEPLEFIDTGKANRK